MVIIEDSLVDAVEHGISQAGGPKFESRWYHLVFDVRFITKSKDFSYEHVQLSVKLHVDAVNVTLNDVTKNVQSVFFVDIDTVTIGVQDETEIDGGWDPSVQVLKHL